MGKRTKFVGTATYCDECLASGSQGLHTHDPYLEQLGPQILTYDSGINSERVTGSVPFSQSLERVQDVNALMK